MMQEKAPVAAQERKMFTEPGSCSAGPAAWWEMELLAPTENGWTFAVGTFRAVVAKGQAIPTPGVLSA